MYKKLLSLLLAAVMLMALAACGDTAGNEIQNDTPAQENAAVPETEAPTEAAKEIEFEETIFVDNESCTFKIIAIDADNMWGYTLKAFLENKTEQDLMFSLTNVSVNGFMCDPFWAATVTPGMKANEEISFSSSDFELNGITDVTDITFDLDVYDNNNWEADYLVSETFTLYPLGEEAVVPYERTAQEGEIVLFDEENCTMIVTGFDPDNMWGYTVNVYLENKTDKDLMFSINDAAVNGFMCDPFWATTVAAGKRSNTAISWMTSDFEANDITEVESLSLPIRVYDENDWSADALIEQTFTVNP